MGPDELAAGLVDLAAVRDRPAAGKTDAAVLVPCFVDERGPVLVFTERRADLRKHAGEISFPGGRRDPGEELTVTALREAEEEIGLERGHVRLLGALPPHNTFASGYRIYPFVGLIPAGLSWRPQQTEVAQVLEISIEQLRSGYRWRPLLARGVPVPTPWYLVDEHLIWGATARLVHHLLGRLPR